jgi:hypothetical protein
MLVVLSPPRASVIRFAKVIYGSAHAFFRGGDGGRLGRGLLLIFGRRLRVEAVTAGADRTTRLGRLFSRRDQK